MRIGRLVGFVAGITLLGACVDAVPTSPGFSPKLVPDAPSIALGFNEDFASGVLDPAWTVVAPARTAYPGLGPANHYSLTDRPGFLRYILDPWTHGDGFVNGYLPTYREHSCCTHDAGLELQRVIGGEHWQLEARVEFNLPFSNGRYLNLMIYFGDGGVGTYILQLSRFRDLTAPENNSVVLVLRPQTGTTYLTTFPPLESYSFGAFGQFDGPASTLYFRAERNGGVLSASWSYDGTTWTQGFSHDAGTDLDGLTQRVVLSGLMWNFLPPSWADWDYINVVPTVIPVGIDILPGSNVNPVNTKRPGVIPVAILSTATFDAVAEVDQSSLTFGHSGTESSFSHCGVPVDVNLDSRPDLVCYFDVQLTGFLATDTMGFLKGTTTGGVAIEGSDVVRLK